MKNEPQNPPSPTPNLKSKIPNSKKAYPLNSERNNSKNSLNADLGPLPHLSLQKNNNQCELSLGGGMSKENNTNLNEYFYIHPPRGRDGHSKRSNKNKGESHQESSVLSHTPQIYAQNVFNMNRHSFEAISGINNEDLINNSKNFYKNAN
jgi:hypothetical protein